MMLPGTGGHVTPLSTRVFALGKNSNQSRKEKQSEPSGRENRSDMMMSPWDIRNIRQALWGTFPMGSRDTFLVEDVNPGLRGTAAAALASRDPVHMIAVGSQEVAIQTLRGEARDYIRGDSKDRSPRSSREKAAARTRGFILAWPGWVLDLRGTVEHAVLARLCRYRRLTGRGFMHSNRDP